MNESKETSRTVTQATVSQDPAALIGQRVMIRRQPAPNSFGRTFPEQRLSGVLTSVRVVSADTWTLCLNYRSTIAYGSDGGCFQAWSIAAEAPGSQSATVTSVSLFDVIEWHTWAGPARFTVTSTDRSGVTLRSSDGYTERYESLPEDARIVPQDPPPIGADLEVGSKLWHHSDTIDWRYIGTHIGPVGTGEWAAMARVAEGGTGTELHVSYRWLRVAQCLPADDWND